MKVSIRNAIVMVGVLIGLLVATILGIYAQDISYYLHERSPTFELTTAITIVTFTSMGLYIIIPILLVAFKKLEKTYATVCVIACVIIGLPISLWSFFVWAMWMG